MSFSDFKGIWKINSAEPDVENVGDEIAIGGNEAAVRIFCSDDKKGHKYINATYEELIRVFDESNNEYTITLARGNPNEIFCASVHRTGVLPGSWTADDSVGHIDGHGRKH